MSYFWNKERRKQRARFYQSAAWRRKRQAILDKHPLCIHCLRSKKISLGKVVDHQNPNWTGWKGFLSGPFLVLCLDCDAEKKWLDDFPKLSKQSKLKIKAVSV